MKVLLLGSGRSHEVFRRRLAAPGGNITIHTYTPAMAAESDRPGTELTRQRNAVQITKHAVDLPADLVVLTDTETVHCGVGNTMQTMRIPCFGPTRVAADFQWDKDYRTTLIDETTAVRSQDLEAIGLRGTIVAMVSGIRCGYAGIVAESAPPAHNGGPPEPEGPAQVLGGLPASLSQKLLGSMLWPVIHRLVAEGANYCGWLCIDLAEDGGWLTATNIACMPGLQTLEALARSEDLDWLATMNSLASVSRLAKLSPASGFPVSLSRSA